MRNAFDLLLTSKHFSKEEKELTLLIHPIVVEEVRKARLKAGYSDDDPGHFEGCFDARIKATQRNFKLIVELFKNASKAQDKFRKMFPQWSPVRQKNVKKLRKIARRIHKDRRNCNVSKVTGSLVAAAGGACFVASLFTPLAAFTIPLALTHGLGGGVAYGTTVVENALLKSKMKKAKKILKADQESFRVMEKWFQRTIELVEAIEAVVGFEMAKHMYSDLKKYWRDLRNSQTLDLASSVRDIRTFLLFFLPLSPLLSQGVLVASISVTFFVSVILLHKRNRLLFDSALITHRLAFGLIVGLDVAVELGRIISSLCMGGTGVATQTLSSSSARGISLGVFAGIGIGLDIVNIALSSYDIHKGSKSKQGKAVEYAAEKLEEEHDFIQHVFLELKASS